MAPRDGHRPSRQWRENDRHKPNRWEAGATLTVLLILLVAAILSRRYRGSGCLSRLWLVPQDPSMSSTNHSVRTRLLACIFASGLCFFGTADVLAGECGCQAGCHSCPTPSRDRCSCQCSIWPKHNCLKKAWGSVSGGFGKMLDWRLCHRGCDEANCDDACDAAMIEELMVPYAPTHSHHHVAPMYPQGTPLNSSEPYRMNDLPPEPPMVMESAPPRDPSQRLPQPRDRVSPPVRKPVPDSNSDIEGGSLFDTLSDPFKDDDDASVNRMRSVRPSNYFSTSSRLQPIGRSLSRGNQSSRRRVSRSVR